jgi:hypothetical protein
MTDRNRTVSRMKIPRISGGMDYIFIQYKNILELTYYNHEGFVTIGSLYDFSVSTGNTKASFTTAAVFFLPFEYVCSATLSTK